MITAILAGSLFSLATLGDSGQGQPKGFLAEPKSGKGPGVLVLHPWWGLNADVKAICTHRAANGFTAFAPGLFEGKTATTEAEAQALTKAFQPKSAELEAQIGEAAKFLERRTGNKQTAVVGFSFGAYYALW